MSFPATKVFSGAEQSRFAEASGDLNPMHLDPLAARRTQMGAPVAHGMHLVLSALDAFAQTTFPLPSVAVLAVNFLKPVYAGEKVTILISRPSPLALAVEVERVRVLTVELEVPAFPVQPTLPAVSPDRMADLSKPRERNLPEIEKMIGRIEAMRVSQISEKLFPAATHWLGARAVNGLAGLSKLVGMECPGLHSIFVGFTVALTAEFSSDALSYSVLSMDERFRRVILSVAGSGLHGVVDAAVRCPPVSQPSFEEIAAKVEPGCFADQRALVVGGSRGIGEYIAKAVAAGGGEVVVTYSVGLEEVRVLVAELRAKGGRVNFLPYDVRQPAAPQLASLKFTPTHLYYCATGQIFRRRGRGFDPAIHQNFRQFYVMGFQDLCSALHKKVGHFSAFYPSSVAVDPGSRPKGMEEYAAAKAEGEQLCADLPRLLPGVEVTIRRFPRLPTDQTATLTSGPGEESMHVVLPMISRRPPLSATRPSGFATLL